MRDVDFSAWPVWMDASGWWVVLLVAVVMAVAAIVYAVRRRRSVWCASAQFFARNYLRPGYVEIRLQRLGNDRGPPRTFPALAWVDTQGKEQQCAWPGSTTYKGGTTATLRLSYDRARGHLAPVHTQGGVASLWQTAWLVEPGDKPRRIPIQGISAALAQLHADKSAHDAVQARLHDTTSHGAGSTPTTAHAAGKRRRSKRRKCKK